jgi:hypothetical protein
MFFARSGPIPKCGLFQLFAHSGAGQLVICPFQNGVPAVVHDGAEPANMMFARSGPISKCGLFLLFCPLRSRPISNLISLVILLLAPGRMHALLLQKLFFINSKIIIY